MAADPYRYFRIEARELLEQLGQGALDLEKSAPSEELVARLLRLAHTLKGAARVVKQPAIATDAHALEDLLTAVRGTTGRVPREQIDAMLARIDRSSRQVATLGAPAPAADTPVGGAEPHEPLDAFRPEVEDLESLVQSVAEAQAHVERLQPAADDRDRMHRLIELVIGHLTRARDTRDSGDRAGADKTLSLVLELNDHLAALERKLTYGVDRLSRELGHINDAAARLRLVRAGAVFRFLERAARDAAAATGKQVAFEAIGGDVRVDSSLLATVQGAVLQLVRNAVAHGIEPADQRRRLGKPAEGRVTLTVSRHGNSVLFACTDDGRGIDVDAVRVALQRKGLSPAGSAAKAPADETDALLRLLLKGGVSTAETVSGVAGRGVGLDVVREAAERLGGDVTMRTSLGTGTTVELRAPFSIASFPALLVESSGVAAAVPLDAVRRTFRVGPDQIVESAEGQSIVDERRSIPFSSMAAIVRPHERPPQLTQTSSAFVVGTGDRAAALAVDRILGTSTITMRPLPALAPATAAVIGVSLDANGVARLVLDPDGLVAVAVQAGKPAPVAPRVRQPVLVIDDSLTTRMLEQSILESAGYDVALASSAEEGLAKARERDYALFLVDVEMPGMDGFTFIEQIRADPRLRETPAILITSRASAEDRQRGRSAGAQDYIVKSEFEQGALLDRIRGLVD